MKMLLPAVLLLLVPMAAAPQESPPSSKQPARPATKVSGDPIEVEQDVNLPDEMRIRMAIERAEGDRRKALEDVKKLSDLSAEVSASYRDRARLSSDDIKKLANIEKLAKRVLTHAGGSEVADKSQETEGLSLADAVDHLNAAATRIKNDMTAHTRHIISATVIASSNEVITLTHLIKRKQKKD